MPWRTLCGFPPTAETVILRVPNRAWRPDTVITDSLGNEIFVLLDQTNEMRSYEAVFGDLEGRRLVCVKRHLNKQFWKDGYYFCTYQPNYPGQKALSDRDVDNKRVYPFSYMQVAAMKGRFFYRLFNNDMTTGPPRLYAENPWMGFMVVCCSPLVRTGRWTAQFHRSTSGKRTISVDMWKNTVEVGPGNDLLAALCMAYVFDRYQCNPFVTVFGREEDEEYEQSDRSLESDDALLENDAAKGDDDDDVDSYDNGYHKGIRKRDKDDDEDDDNNKYDERSDDSDKDQGPPFDFEIEPDNDNDDDDGDDKGKRDYTQQTPPTGYAARPVYDDTYYGGEGDDGSISIGGDLSVTQDEYERKQKEPVEII